MSTLIRRDIPTLIIAILGFGLVAEWFWGGTIFPVLSDYKSMMGKYMSIISYTARGIGTFYGLTSEWYMLQRARASGEPRKIWGQYFITGTFFTIMFIMLFIAFAFNFPNSVRSPEYKWWYYNTYQQFYQGQYAVMFIYQTGAIYRVCRARSMETIVLMVAGIAFILRSIPIFVSYIPGLLELGNWFAFAPALAGTRAATLTASLGALVVGLRGLIGREQTTIEVR